MGQERRNRNESSSEKKPTEFLWQLTVMKDKIRILVNGIQQTAWASNTVKM
jgi:hypothetical protein